MPAYRRNAPFERIREVLTARIEATSLRRVARDVGMSPTGLRKLLEGSRPYSATRQKLERWYVRETAQYGGPLSAGSAFAALRVLVQDLPVAHRRGALEGLFAAVREAYAAAQTPEPVWLEELRELVERGPTT